MRDLSLDPINTISRRRWRIREDMFHLRNTVCNSIDFYRDRLENQWPAIEDALKGSHSSLSDFELAGILHPVHLCIRRDQSLLSDMERVSHYVESSATETLLNELKEVEDAFKPNGILSKQHLIE